MEPCPLLREGLVSEIFPKRGKSDFPKKSVLKSVSYPITCFHTTFFNFIFYKASAGSCFA